MTQQPYREVTLLVHAGAGSGTGGRYALQVTEGVRTAFADAEVDVVMTGSKEHIKHIGRTSTADLIVCLTGDGSVHDLAQTLVGRPEGTRPTVAVVPAGSGNDFARTLGMPLDPAAAVAALAECVPVKADVGRVNSTYFLETLSFGVDAAVALNTEELRKATQARGTYLYARAAVSAILHEFDSHRVEIRTADGGSTLDTLILAVQNGPTYGGGFRVAPRASITDGVLDVYTISGISKPVALYYLSQMKGGKHERLKGTRHFTTAHLELTFTEQAPIQCDGERLLGLEFAIDVVPAALDVLASPASVAHGQGRPR